MDVSDLITDSAVLIINGLQLTATRGGLSFDPGETWDDFMFPGRRMNRKGCRELVRLQPTIKGTALFTGEAQVSAYRPDGTWFDASESDTRIFRPNALRTDVALGDYLQNVFCVWKRKRGDYFAVEFPWAICSQWSIGAQDGDEGLIPLVIEAAQNPADEGTTKTRRAYRLHTFPSDTLVADLS